MKKTIVSDSEKYKASRKKKRITFFKKISIFFLVIFLFSIISAVFLSLDRFTVKKILVEGINDSDAQIVKNMIAEEISGKYFFLFPKSNTLLLPKNKIKNNLTNTF